MFQVSGSNAYLLPLYIYLPWNNITLRTESSQKLKDMWVKYCLQFASTKGVKAKVTKCRACAVQCSVEETEEDVYSKLPKDQTHLKK